MLIIGTTDLDRHFHPFGIGVCCKSLLKSLLVGLRKLKLKPRDDYVLVSDAAESIKNAFVSVFGNKKMVMCWFHMKTCVGHHLNLIEDADDRTQVLKDIYNLHICWFKGYLIRKK